MGSVLNLELPACHIRQSTSIRLLVRALSRRARLPSANFSWYCDRFVPGEPLFLFNKSNGSWTRQALAARMAMLSYESNDRLHPHRSCQSHATNASGAEWMYTAFQRPLVNARREPMPHFVFAKPGESSSLELG